MSEIRDALEAWRQANREFQALTPWTTEWLRARKVEEDRRATYLALRDDEDPGDDVIGRSLGERRAWAVDKIDQ